MKLLFILIILFYGGCTSVKTQTVNTPKKECLNELILDKRENKLDSQFLVNKQNRSPLTIINETIKDSISSDLLEDYEKKKLINAFTKVKLTNTKKLKRVKPKTSCGVFFNDKFGVNLLRINSDYNFFLLEGFKKTQEKDKEILILQKYKDSSNVLFKEEPLLFNKGSFFKLDEAKNHFFSKNYETYSNDGGDFWTTYKTSNIFSYRTNGWLKSGTSHRSFFKHYFSEEKKFISSKEDEVLDVIWNYTYFETILDKNNSFIQEIVIYYVELDNTNINEKPIFSIQKQILTFKPFQEKE